MCSSDLVSTKIGQSRSAVCLIRWASPVSRPVSATRPGVGRRHARHHAQVAGQMESSVQAEACGVSVAASTHPTGAAEDVGNLVGPELPRRGLFREEYADGTLRDNLGFARP